MREEVYRSFGRVQYKVIAESGGVNAEITRGKTSLKQETEAVAGLVERCEWLSMAHKMSIIEDAEKWKACLECSEELCGIRARIPGWPRAQEPEEDPREKTFRIVGERKTRRRTTSGIGTTMDARKMSGISGHSSLWW
jgi:hypothetical protein